MNHQHISIATTDKLIATLNRFFADLEKMHQHNDPIDLSVPFLSTDDYEKLAEFTKLTEGHVSNECWEARVEFLKYFRKLSKVEREALREFKFQYHHGLNQSEEITFAKAFGLGNYPRPNLLDSLIKLWQLVVTIQPEKINLIPQTLKDYARHSFIFFGVREIAHPLPTPRVQSSNGIRLFDINATSIKPANGNTFPLLSSILNRASQP